MPSVCPANPPPCSRIRPTRKGLLPSRTIPASTLPSTCWAASPRITAVNAPPTARVPGFSPAMRSAITTTSPIVSRRTRKPIVPAVPGSSRRYSAGPIHRPSERASPQPRMTSRATVAIPHLKPVAGEEFLSLREQEEHHGDQRQRDHSPAAASAGGCPVDLRPESGLAPDLAGLESRFRSGQPNCGASSRFAPSEPAWNLRGLTVARAFAQRRPGR